MDLATVSAAGWVALALGAVLVGFSKTAVAGVGLLAVATYATVLPARESTGVLLLLLLVGDLVAIRAYRRHVDWAILIRLIPSVAVGIVVGVVFVGRVDDTLMRRTIGGVLLLLVAVHLVRKWLARRRTRREAASAGAGGPAPEEEPVEPGAPRRVVTAGAGVLAGFTSMVANAGGGVMTVYLLGAGLRVMAFLGTVAWFFFVVNLTKVPFSIALGLISSQTLVLLVLMAPAVLVGAFVGRRVVRHLDATTFEWLVLGFTVLAALNLLR
ncbi:MAG: sulfite exporter TauE/SafE family protein [Candidatus Nanopelagicales bacterium]